MKIIVSETKQELGLKAAEKGAELIQKTLLKKGFANIIVATGASQFEMLKVLIKQKVDWSKVSCFHLDEYIGMPITHPASFRKYLKDRFVDKINLKAFNYIDAEFNPEKECHRLNAIISKLTIDVAFVGIGENGHLAFNDPPADFETEAPYIVVDLDKNCRVQQMGEGWFSALEDVPKQAISMSIKQILKSDMIICSVPDKRKAKAVQGATEGKVTAMVPSSILQNHHATWLYLDKDSSTMLRKI